MIGLHAYKESQRPELQDVPYYSLIMAAMRRADDRNIMKLQAAWPDVWSELVRRYHAPGGLLPGEGDHTGSEKLVEMEE